MISLLRAVDGGSPHSATGQTGLLSQGIPDPLLTTAYQNVYRLSLTGLYHNKLRCNLSF